MDRKNEENILLETDVLEEDKTNMVVYKKRKWNVRNMLILSMILLTIITALAFISIPTFANLDTEEDTLGNQDLIAMGSAFYEDFYYPQISNAYAEDQRNDFLAKYSDIGIKINLDNLSRYENVDDKVKDYLDVCDIEETMLIIYPTSPYGSKDYKIDAVLMCDK